MKTLGITGGIGSGKSTVCHIFEELGARVFYADEEAKRLMIEDPDVRSQITAAFGSESYDDSGRLNRTYLARKVFKQPRALRRISHIVHPRVFDAFEHARAKAEHDGVPLLVKEAAILFESGGDRHVDAVAVVDAPTEVRLRRVMERDAVAEEDVRARMRNQLPAAELRARADYVIDNGKDTAALRKQVERIFREMTAGGPETP